MDDPIGNAHPQQAYVSKAMREMITEVYSAGIGIERSQMEADVLV
jgi:hypothetical protein